MIQKYKIAFYVRPVGVVPDQPLDKMDWKQIVLELDKEGDPVQNRIQIFAAAASIAEYLHRLAEPTPPDTVFCSVATQTSEML